MGVVSGSILTYVHKQKHFVLSSLSPETAD